jgi:D-tyrosyl-tRNA(Tyr) deacylase
LRAVIQRVSEASVAAPGHAARIDRGLVVLVGVERGDGAADVEYIARKIRELRVFDDDAAGADATNKGFARSVQDVGGRVLLVSQFTLAADCTRGRRPSFDAAAPPDVAKPLYESVVHELERAGIAVATGQFQAMMQVALVNDGPVTLLLDSRKRF